MIGLKNGLLPLLLSMIAVCLHPMQENIAYKKNLAMLDSLKRHRAHIFNPLDTDDFMLSILTPAFSNQINSDMAIHLLQLGIDHGYWVNVLFFNSFVELSSQQPLLIRWFVEHGATVNRKPATRAGIKIVFSEPLLQAIALKEIENAISLLKDLSERPDLSKEDQQLILKALQLASAQGVLPIVEELIPLFDSIQVNDFEGAQAYGESLVRAALNGHDDVFHLLSDRRKESIRENPDLWRTYLDQALFYAVVQGSTHKEYEGYFSIAQSLLNQEFLHALGLSLEHADKGLQELIQATEEAKSTSLAEDDKEKIRILLERAKKFQTLLARHQPAQELAYLTKEQAQRPASFLSTLPRELIEQKLMRYVYGGSRSL